MWHAAEVNLVLRSLDQGKPNVVNRVLPRAKLDLVSYSAWDAMPGKGDLRRALDYIAAQAPDSAAFGARNVYLGEFGWPENDGLEKHREIVRSAVETALDWGCPWIIYWQLFCNEPKRTPVSANDDCRGFWLLKPDGTRAWAWDYLHGLLRGPAAPVDLMADTWEVVDVLGRTAVTAPEAPAPRADRFVGVFYFLWQGAHGQSGPHDISKILAAHPEAITDASHSLWLAWASGVTPFGQPRPRASCQLQPLSVTANAAKVAARPTFLMTRPRDVTLAPPVYNLVRRTHRAGFTGRCTHIAARILRSVDHRGTAC